MRVDIGALVLNTGTPDAIGSQWYLTGLEGWDAPAQRLSTGEATSKHGGILLESMYGPRAITVRGLCKADTEAHYWDSYNYLLGLISNPSTQVAFSVFELPTTKRVSVIRGGQPKIDLGAGISTFTFEVPLLALDPLKYGTTLHTVTAGTITNAGTAESFPVATLTAGGNLSLTNSTYGRTVSTVTSLASGAVADFGRRTVYEGSVNRYQYVNPASVWWGLLPGANTVSNGGAAANIAYYDAWI